jgi:hypothetical protein
MPTIDRLAPTTAASDTDELMASQNGVVVKVTRGQVIAGLQPTISIPSQTIIGRSSSGVGAPEALTVGANLVINGGTVSSTSGYIVASLPSGTVPAVGDLVAMSQNGANTAVPYGQFISGLPEVSGLNASSMLVTATGTSKSQKLADFAAGTLPTTGGTMTGALVLAANPTTPLQASPKQYVDMRAATALPVAGGTMTGALTLASDPTASLHATTKEYVDTQIAAALPKSGGTMTGVLALSADPVASSQAATKHYVDNQVLTSLPTAGGAMTGPLTLAANPTMPLQAAAKQYVDAQAAAGLPVAGGTMTGALVLAGAPTAASQAATKGYVDTQVVTAVPKAGGTMTGLLVLSGDPVVSGQAATKNYVDGQVLTSLPIAGGTMAGPLTLPANPTASLQAAPKQYVDAQVASVMSSLPTAPIIGAAGGRFTSVALPAGGGLSLVGGSLSLAPAGFDLTSGDVTPSDTGVAATLGAAIGGRLSATGDASASTVVTTGSSAARTLAARFSDIANAKDYGAKGDGVTDDTAAIQRWLAAVGSSGGTGYVPPGSYILSNVITQTLAGVSVNLRGAGAGNTRFVFTGSSNGLVLGLTRALGVWGAARVSDISIVRGQTAPAQANVGLSIIVDSTQGVEYFGNSGVSDIFIQGSSPGTNAWSTGILLQDTTSFEIRNTYILGPNASNAGTDSGVSIVGTSASTFSVQTDITDSSIQGFSAGINVTGYVQGLFVENSAIIGDWWGINWQGVSAATSYSAASSVPAGSSTIYLSPSDAAALLASEGAIVNGSGISPQTRIANTGSSLNINTSTGAITINTPTTAAIAPGQSLTFVTYFTAEALNVINCTFNATYRGIYGSWLGFSQIENCSFLRGGLAASNWAAIDLEECNNTTVSANQILGAFSGSETGIIINSLGGQGGAPNVVTGNVVNGVSGYGIVLGGTTKNTTTVANTGYACVAAVSSSQQNVNPIFGNQSNDNPPDMSLNTATGVLYFNGKSFVFGNNTATNVNFSINSAAGGGNLNFSADGLSNWIVGGSAYSLAIARCVTPGVETDIPFVLDTATGSLSLLYRLTIGGTVQQQGMVSSAPSSGATVAISAGVSDYRILGSSPLSALTVELPASPVNGQMIRVSSQVAIASLSVRDSGGGMSDVQAPPVALLAGGAFSAQWNASASVWWCSVGS